MSRYRDPHLQVTEKLVSYVKFESQHNMSVLRLKAYFTLNNWLTLARIPSGTSYDISDSRQIGNLQYIVTCTRISLKSILSRLIKLIVFLRGVPTQYPPVPFLHFWGAYCKES